MTAMAKPHHPVVRRESPPDDASEVLPSRRSGARRYFCCVSKRNLDEVDDTVAPALRRDSPPAVASAVSQRSKQVVANREARAAAARASVQAAIERERDGGERKRQKSEQTASDDSGAADPIDDKTLTVDDLTAEVDAPPVPASEMDPRQELEDEPEGGGSPAPEAPDARSPPEHTRTQIEQVPRGGALRQFRKGVARTTGISGFFSGKARPRGSDAEPP